MPSFAKTSAIFFRVTAIDERLDNDITKLSYQCIKFGKSNSKVGITAHAYLNGKKRIFSTFISWKMATDGSSIDDDGYFILGTFFHVMLLLLGNLAFLPFHVEPL